MTNSVMTSDSAVVWADDEAEIERLVVEATMAGIEVSSVRADHDIHEVLDQMERLSVRLDARNQLSGELLVAVHHAASLTGACTGDDEVARQCVGFLMDRLARRGRSGNMRLVLCLDPEALASLRAGRPGTMAAMA